MQVLTSERWKNSVKPLFCLNQPLVIQKALSCYTVTCSLHLIVLQKHIYKNLSAKAHAVTIYMLTKWISSYWLGVNSESSWSISVRWQDEKNILYTTLSGVLTKNVISTGNYSCSGLCLEQLSLSLHNCLVLSRLPSYIHNWINSR